MKPDNIRIGTRGSALAMIQTNMVADKLRTAHPDLSIDIVEIRTSGDWKPEHGEVRLDSDAGGKGLFAKEIEEALLTGRIDCGVHSLKDMPAVLSPGLAINHVLPREDARDAFVSEKFARLEDMPEGAVVGTSSLRRQAMILAKRPDLKIVTVRGNVPTRIEKMRGGMTDALILAVAGLRRLGRETEIKSYMGISVLLPAAGQGAIGIETRTDDPVTCGLVDPLHCRQTGLRVIAERAALEALGGGCHTPVGAYASLAGDQLRLDVAVVTPDGRTFYRDSASAQIADNAEAFDLGYGVGMALKKIVPPSLLQIL